MSDNEIDQIQEVVIAVKNATDAVNLFEELFNLKFDIEWQMPNEHMNVKAAQIGKTQLHIVESTASDGIIAKFIDSRGPGLHHIAFKVKNLKDWVARLKIKGVKLIPDEPIIYPQGSYIFIHPKSVCGVLVELIEHKD
jgi:methylmalonyl-CoA epimerase